MLVNSIYFAGPDVFKLNANEIKENYLELATKYGFIGLFPLDNEIDLLQKNVDAEIYKLNIQLLTKSEYVIANLNNFRGHEPDSGTVFEVAYALALGKKVIGYVQNNKTMLEKINLYESVYQKEDLFIDENNQIIENFNNQLNLMLQHGLTKLVIGNVEDALKYIKTAF